MKTALIKASKQLAKLLMNYFTGRSSDGEGGKKGASVIIGVIFILILVPIISISLPGILLKGSANKNVEGSNNVYDNIYTFLGGELNEYDVYIGIRDSYIEYINELNEKISEEITRIREESSYTEYETILVEDDSGKFHEEEISYQVYPEIIKKISIEKPRYSHLMAYIAIKHINNQGLDKNNVYKFDKKEAKDFLNYIMTYEQNTKGTDPIYFNAKTTVLSVEEIAQHFFSTELERGQYITSFYSIENDEEELLQELYQYIDLNTINIHSKGIKIPHLLQYDESWGNISYRSETIKSKGAAPVSLAMVLSFYENKLIRPDEIIENIKEDYSNEWRIFEEISKKYGVKCVNIGKAQNKLINAIENGYPIIAFMKKGEYSPYIVIREITGENKIYINDPNDIFSSKDLYLKGYNINEIYANANTFFMFKK